MIKMLFISSLKLFPFSRYENEVLTFGHVEKIAVLERLG